jgi:hypothetical protein
MRATWKDSTAVNWSACIGSARWLGVAGFLGSFVTLSGVESDPALLLDRALHGMFGGALVGLAVGGLLAWLMREEAQPEEGGSKA